jgi:hypothetical protein
MGQDVEKIGLSIEFGKSHVFNKTHGLNMDSD